MLDTRSTGHKRLSTKINLDARGDADLILCLLCKENFESLDHLFASWLIDDLFMALDWYLVGYYCFVLLV